MTHHVSPDDRQFQRTFEACEVAPEAFDHSAHVRLAYIYLCGHSVDDAAQRMKTALLAFLNHLGVGGGQYHETVTRAWIMAVDHFMAKSAPCQAASAFMNLNPELLDSKIMLTHYSAALLFSPAACQAFISPDIQDIPPR
jgi:hypothetical protein